MSRNIAPRQPWPWPEMMDALLAAPASHRLLLENDQVRVLDVVIEAGARDGHTGAVTAAARLIAAEGRAGMLTLPGDIPLVTPGEISSILAAHSPAPSFTIVPSHDERGSNAIACSPPDAVPLRFGENSFYPHLEAAEACGVRPNVVRLPGIALDIDNPEDVVSFMRTQSATRAWAVLAEELMPPVGSFRR